MGNFAKFSASRRSPISRQLSMSVHLAPASKRPAVQLPAAVHTQKKQSSCGRPAVATTRKKRPQQPYKGDSGTAHCKVFVRVGWVLASLWNRQNEKKASFSFASGWIGCNDGSEWEIYSRGRKPTTKHANTAALDLVESVKTWYVYK